jgi:hypothetical protein
VRCQFSQSLFGILQGDRRPGGHAVTDAS